MPGVNTERAGRVVVIAVAATIAAAYAGTSMPWRNNTAAPSMPPAWTARPHRRTRCAPWRRMNPPTASANTVAGTSSSTVTADASPTPPAL